jgi:hypothetical protein
MKCETLSYAGLGEEIQCGNEAVALFDQGTRYMFPICQECIDLGVFNPSRITPLPKEEAGEQERRRPKR